MDLLRIGDKLISKRRILSSIDRILELRMEGHSQQEVADILGIDRTLISRLESLGEVRKGGRIGLIGFPIANKDEVRQAAEEAGVDFLLLLSDAERWELVTEGSGAELFNQILEWIAQLKEFDSVIFIGSDMRIGLAEAVLGSDIVIGMSLGPSPIKGDRRVDPEAVASLIRSLRV
ncbi:MAG: transcriptional regulator [Firmicutes bacterium]|nr:transcriptional regulator [Bacillota bacterium]